jgi:hypothetical protein
LLPGAEWAFFLFESEKIVAAFLNKKYPQTTGYTAAAFFK